MKSKTNKKLNVAQKIYKPSQNWWSDELIRLKIIKEYAFNTRKLKSKFAQYLVKLSQSSKRLRHVGCRLCVQTRSLGRDFDFPAKKLNRNFIGCDNNPDYISISNERLKNRTFNKQLEVEIK